MTHPHEDPRRNPDGRARHSAAISPHEGPQVEINPVAHLLAPIAAVAATFVVRKVLDRGYRTVTGSRAPEARDPGVSLGRALMWTAATAVTAALVEVAVYRLANQWGARPTSEN
ncbi:MAG: DUF4235 domain-containing protein [Actinomycetes bacterium]